MSRGFSGDDVLLSLMGLTLILLVVAAVLLGQFLLALVQELGRIYLERGPLPDRTKQVLWGALLVFGVLSLLCLGLALLTASLVPLGVYGVCWGFLGFVLVIETADWWGRRQLGPPTLDTYLPFAAGDPSRAEAEIAV